MEHFTFSSPHTCQKEQCLQWKSCPSENAVSPLRNAHLDDLFQNFNSPSLVLLFSRNCHGPQTVQRGALELCQCFPSEGSTVPPGASDPDPLLTQGSSALRPFLPAASCPERLGVWKHFDENPFTWENQCGTEISSAPRSEKL